MLNDNQVKAIANDISSIDVIDYIKNHKKEYQQFLVEKQTKKECNNEEIRRIEEAIKLGKLELSITR